MNYDLSILIPARNEMFLSKTVEDILKNKIGKTEIIIGLDGQWSVPPIPEHDDVTILYSPVSLGQRAMTNQLCRLSKAKYVMKLDAHCALDHGFDAKMMQYMEDDITMIPLMKNLHAFDWVCGCGHRIYQSPTPEVCPNCKKEKMVRDVVWIAKDSPKSTAFRFDKTLHFQYWPELKERMKPVAEKNHNLTETLSIQGSCFMLTREKYWELNICDEEFGSWGQQGVEVACKTWLSGGRVICNQNTWYAHMFRTQGGDFGFPYPQSGKQLQHAREYSRDIFINDKWPQAIHSFQWLLDKFAPVPEWHDGDHVKESKENKHDKGDMLSKQILYYTDNQLNLKTAHAVQRQLNKVGLPITSVSLKPMDFGRNIHFKGERGYLTMARQILTGLQASTADIIYFTEHDVFYHPSHFDFIPPEKDKYYYNTNVWRVRQQDGHALWCDDLQQLSGLIAYRETLIKHFEKRLKALNQAYIHLEMSGRSEEFNKYVREVGFEPGTHNRVPELTDYSSESFKSRLPNLDIRHDNNLTPSRWNKEQFRNEKYTKGWKEVDLGHDFLKDYEKTIEFLSSR